MILSVKLNNVKKMNPNKLENPARLAELNPTDTLKKIGFGKHDVLCDIGAGTGIFTIPAARITDNTVLALDINDEFLNIIAEKAQKEKLTNIRTLKVTDNYHDIDSQTVDFVLLVTVLHEITDKKALLNEIRKIIKETGKLAIIEFHAKQTPMGPPVEHRLSKDAVHLVCFSHGFSKSKEFDMGDNYYCMVFNA